MCLLNGLIFTPLHWQFKNRVDTTFAEGNSTQCTIRRSVSVNLMSGLAKEHSSEHYFHKSLCEEKFSQTSNFRT